jgi:YHS domain-containing protein
MANTAIDPVCGMSVDKNNAPAKAHYEGNTYYFCSTDCKTKFQQNPEEYAKQAAAQAHR